MYTPNKIYKRRPTPSCTILCKFIYLFILLRTREQSNFSAPSKQERKAKSTNSWPLHIAISPFNQCNSTLRRCWSFHQYPVVSCLSCVSVACTEPRTASLLKMWLKQIESLFSETLGTEWMIAKEINHFFQFSQRLVTNTINDSF